MGFLKKLLDPREHFKDAKRGVKAIKKGDYMGALDPANVLHAPPTPATQGQAAAPRTPYMGLSGPTTLLGGSGGGRQYVPNQFQGSGAMMLNPAAGGASAGMGGGAPQQPPLSPQGGAMGAPARVGAGTPMPGAAGPINAQPRNIKQLAMANALRAGPAK